jgi:hypothetical protein
MTEPNRIVGELFTLLLLRLISERCPSFGCFLVFWQSVRYYRRLTGELRLHPLTNKNTDFDSHIGQPASRGVSNPTADYGLRCLRRLKLSTADNGLEVYRGLRRRLGLYETV